MSYWGKLQLSWRQVDWRHLVNTVHPEPLHRGISPRLPGRGYTGILLNAITNSNKLFFILHKNYLEKHEMYKASVHVEGEIQFLHARSFVLCLLFKKKINSIKYRHLKIKTRLGHEMSISELRICNSPKRKKKQIVNHFPWFYISLCYAFTEHLTRNACTPTYSWTYLISQSSGSSANHDLNDFKHGMIVDVRWTGWVFL